jgi:hypothetical protein
MGQSSPKLSNNGCGCRLLLVHAYLMVNACLPPEYFWNELLVNCYYPVRVRNQVFLSVTQNVFGVYHALLHTPYIERHLTSVCWSKHDTKGIL